MCCAGLQVELPELNSPERKTVHADIRLKSTFVAESAAAGQKASFQDLLRIMRAWADLGEGKMTEAQTGAPAAPY